MLPSIEEFRKSSRKQVRDFFKQIFTGLSKHDQDTFLGCDYLGEVLVTLSYEDLRADGLGAGAGRWIMMVVDKIKKKWKLEFET